MGGFGYSEKRPKSSAVYTSSAYTSNKFRSFNQKAGIRQNNQISFNNFTVNQSRTNISNASTSYGFNTN